MRKGKLWGFLTALCILLATGAARADDTCVFAVTANDVPPNVVILLDNGAEMEQIIWHSAYDNSIDYTPGGGSVFTNTRGYAVVKSGNTFYLQPIQADLTLTSTDAIAAPANNNPTWVINGRSITLPFAPSTSVDASGIKDNASRFRYTTNYLNWLFYGPYAGNGSDLPAKTRFYYAKQALFAVARQTANRAKFGVYAFTSNATGASNVQPLKMVVSTPLVEPSSSNVLDANFVNNLNNLNTFTYSPLAEGLASIGGYFDSPSSGVVDVYCQRNFALVVSPGVSSEDLSTAAGSLPSSFSDYDNDGLDGVATLTIDDVTYAIPKNKNGSTWLDDVAHYMATNDMVGYRTGNQYVNTYTVGFMSSEGSRRFLINASNNGNENKNLYDSTDPEYGKYHFDAASPEGLAQSIMDALNAILEKTNAFSAPVVPITRTTSGNRLYMSFFTPSSKTNFWQGNVVKFGLNANLDIVDKNGDPATYPNGALRETAVPYWQTLDWADDVTAANGIHNSSRKIYTWLGGTRNLADPVNHFTTANVDAAKLANPVHGAENIIKYVRGADAFDADSDGITSENRALITGSVLHSEPLVYEYIHASGTLNITSIDGTFQVGEIVRDSKGGYATVTATGGGQLEYADLKAPFSPGAKLTGQTSGATATVSLVPDVTMIYYGANDGMLHAVRDTDGIEAWGFIPPNQLARLKLMVEATSHQYYVDSSPKMYLHDVNGNGFIDLADGDKVILVSGERKGSSGYFALDVTSPEVPRLLWRINRANDLAYAPPDQVFAQLGESWSEPRFGKVKTSAADATGTPVVVVGGGFSATSATGRAVLVLNVLTGAPVRIFENDGDGNVNTGSNISGMTYSIPSAVRVMDADRNGFIDKIYVGDIGGQVWRIGRFDKDEQGNAIAFPAANENVNDWQGQKLFTAGCSESSCTDGVDNNGNGLIDERRKFFYPPTVTLERGYDFVLIGSGDRENPCHWQTLEEMYAIKDDHSLQPNTLPLPTAWTRADLSDITSAALDPTLKGWYLRLAAGEKVLAENTVFAGVLYFTTFTPNNDPCMPGGAATIYAVDYRNGDAVLNLVPAEEGLERGVVIGGGIPSRPVIVISEGGVGMFASVGSTNPDAASSDNTGAGIIKPPMKEFALNFHYIWWRGTFN